VVAAVIAQSAGLHPGVRVRSVERDDEVTTRPGAEFGAKGSEPGVVPDPREFAAAAVVEQVVLLVRHDLKPEDRDDQPQPGDRDLPRSNAAAAEREFPNAARDEHHQERPERPDELALHVNALRPKGSEYKRRDKERTRRRHGRRQPPTGSGAAHGGRDDAQGGGDGTAQHERPDRREFGPEDARRGRVVVHPQARRPHAERER